MIDLYQAVGIVEGFISCDDELTYIEAVQKLIDTGVAWQLQGSIGRICKHYIETGECYV